MINNRLRQLVLAAAVVTATGIFVRCADPLVPVSAPADAVLAKGGGGKPGGGGSGDPTVTAADPAFAEQGDEDQLITISGSGFSGEVEVAWERSGVASEKITVHSAAIVNSSTIVARVSFAPDADLGFYDISVTLVAGGGKRGVGTEMFEVTTAEVLGITGYGDAYAVTDDGSIVAGGSPVPNFSNVYEDGVGIVNLGGTEVWAIDPLGTALFARSEPGVTAFVRQAPGVYSSEFLPSTPGTIRSNPRIAARAANGDLIVGGAEVVLVTVTETKGKKVTTTTSSSPQPTVWRRSGGTWSMPVRYAYPPGAAGSHIGGVSATGVAAGLADNRTIGLIWENPSTYVIMDGLPAAINPAGTVVVGVRNGMPVYWTRSPSTGAWNTTAVVLPSLGGTCATEGARSINAAGVIVGASCNASGVAQATVWMLDVSGTPSLAGPPLALPGLGAKGTKAEPASAAWRVAGSLPSVVVGFAKAVSGHRNVVRWRLNGI